MRAQMKSSETYINHPTFGLLFRVCTVGDRQELFTTLYAQRLFFLVTTHSDGLAFEPMGRSEARLLVENRLRQLRRIGAAADFKDLDAVYQRTFQ